MSKKNIKVIITCLILVLIVILSSCDGTRKGSYIEAKDRLTGNDELRINIKLQNFMEAASICSLMTFQPKSLQTISTSMMMKTLISPPAFTRTSMFSLRRLTRMTNF